MSTDQYRKWGPISLLLIEDNPGDVTLFREALRHAYDFSFKLTHVERITQAIEELNKHKYNIIVMDLSLPDAEGFDGVDRIVKAFPHIPTVVLTSLVDDSAGIEAVRMGAQDYLVKGQFDGRTLTRALQYAIERKRGSQSPQSNDQENQPPA